jgi:hypothetical protein
MGRGGARPGAGRKPALTFFERTLVGGLCEDICLKRAKNVAKGKIAVQVDNRLRRSGMDIDEERPYIKNIPYHDFDENGDLYLVTCSRTGRPFREVVVEMSHDPESVPQDPDDPDDTAREAALALQRLRTTLDTVGRIYSQPLRRPQGVEKDIIQKVHRLLLKRFPRLTPRLVKQCWEEFRTLERQMRSAQGGGPQDEA